MKLLGTSLSFCYEVTQKDLCLNRVMSFVICFISPEKGSRGCIGLRLLGIIKFTHLNYWLKKDHSCRICTRLRC